MKTKRYFLEYERGAFEHEVWDEVQFLAKILEVELDVLIIRKFVVRTLDTREFGILEMFEDKEIPIRVILAYYALKIILV